MWTGVQRTGNLGGGQSRRWFTWGWPTSWHVVWYMMPISPQAGSPQVGWDVSVERATQSQCTYWITVRNLTPNNVTFEGRFAVLS